MKRVYDFMRRDENMSWCKPLSLLDGKVIIAVNEGKICGCCVNGKDREDLTVADLAKMCNDSYADYEGYSDMHILLDSDCHELGCADCPWRDTCDAMTDADSLINYMGEGKYYGMVNAENAFDDWAYEHEVGVEGSEMEDLIIDWRSIEFEDGDWTVTCEDSDGRVYGLYLNGGDVIIR